MALTSDLSGKIGSMDEPRLPRPKRPYFSERQGRGPFQNPVDFPEIRKMLGDLFDRLQEAGYFQEAFGYWCVDAHDVPGTLGANADGYFRRAVGRDGIWPWDRQVSPAELWPGDIRADAWDSAPAWTFWDEDTWFDVLEVVHDLISKPVDGWHHDFSGCGWHWSKFDHEAGADLFREEVSWALGHGDPAYEMTGDGEIVLAAPDGFRPLLTAEVPQGTERDEVQAKVDAAVKLFRGRHASDVDRQHAVRDLADVLEHLRGDMKAVMLRKDESDLFNIANNFAVRHNNPRQRRDYDRTTWHRWMFYVYLATIHAVLRVRSNAATDRTQ